MSKYLSLTLLLSLFISGTCIAADTAVNVIQLKMIKPAETFFTGKAEAVDVHTLSFGANEGRIAWTLRPGDIFEGPIHNTDGTVEKEGTLLAEMDNDDQAGQVESAQLAVKVAEYEYKLNLSEYDRGLKSQRAISASELEKKKIAVLKSKLKLEDAKNNLVSKKYFLKRTRIYAPYTGIILEIIRGPGMGTGKGDDCIKIQRMSPMLVKVPFASEIINYTMSQNGPTFIYTPYTNEPLVGWVEQSPLDKNTLFVYVDNELTATAQMDSDEEKLPKVYGMFPVLGFYEKSVVANLGLKIGKTPENDNMLGTAKHAIRKDDKGEYVLRIVGIKALQPTGIPVDKFKVERVDVKVGKLYRDIDLGQYTSFELVNFEDSGSLAKEDVVVLFSDDTLKAGDTATYAAPHWIFNPGDILKVKIPDLTKEGIYVPQSAIIHEAEGSNYVYIAQDGKVKLVAVKLVGRITGHYAITGDGIQEGVLIIIPDDKKAAGTLYDGMSITIKSVMTLNERIAMPHADPLIPFEQLSFF